jgi:Uma2 family endonuclease
MRPAVHGTVRAVKGRDMELEAPFGTHFRRISVPEYERMVEVGILEANEKIELLDGVIVAVSPQGEPHALVVERLNRALVLALSEHYRVRPQLPMHASEYSEPEPDLIVVARSEGDPRGHPRSAALIIEVADSSLSKDRRWKGRIYAEAGVREYWIVNVADRCIEVYRQPDQAKGTWRNCETFAVGSSVKPAELPGPTIEVAALFA